MIPKYGKTYSFDATRYLDPYRKERVRRPVSLQLAEHTYPPGDDPENSWLAIALRAFAQLAYKIPVRDLLIIGTSNGLDGLGAIEIFDLASLTATDLFEESLAIAQANIVSNLKENTQIDTSYYVGDLLSCVPVEKRFDLIYENLPNLPAPKNVALETGADNNPGWFFDKDASNSLVPDLFGSHLLALHYLCLRQAHDRVREGGGVLTAIGGRVPLEVVFKLHRACGYVPELVVFDLKIQGEPESVLPAYCQAKEETGVEFQYYAAEARDLVRAARNSGLEGQGLADAVKGDLDRYAMSSHEALAQHRQGKDVAHSTLMVFGQRN